MLWIFSNWSCREEGEGMEVVFVVLVVVLGGGGDVEARDVVVVVVVEDDVLEVEGEVEGEVEMLDAMLALRNWSL